MIGKVGTKQRHVEIPEGWEQVTSGNCHKGDRFLNMHLFPEDGTVQWKDAEPDDVGYSHDGFDCLIRKNKENKP